MVITCDRPVLLFMAVEKDRQDREEAEKREREKVAARERRKAELAVRGSVFRGANRTCSVSQADIRCAGPGVVSLRP